MAAWLIEAALLANDSSSQALSVISQAPALFPFIVNSISPRDFDTNGRIEFFHQGMDERMVMLHGV